MKAGLDDQPLEELNILHISQQHSVPGRARVGLTASGLNPLGTQWGTRGAEAFSWEGNDCRRASTHSIKLLVCWCRCWKAKQSSCVRNINTLFSHYFRLSVDCNPVKINVHWCGLKRAFGFLSSSPLMPSSQRKLKDFFFFFVCILVGHYETNSLFFILQKPPPAH